MTDLADYYTLTRAQRDLLVAVAQYNDTGQTPNGTEVCDRVQELRGGERPTDMTTYNGLRQLSEYGLVESDTSGFANEYRVTPHGEDVIQAVHDELPAQD